MGVKGRVVLVSKSPSQSSPLVTSSPGPLRVLGLSEIPKNFSIFSLKLVGARCLLGVPLVVCVWVCPWMSLTVNEIRKTQIISLFMAFLPGARAGISVVCTEEHAKYVVVSHDPDSSVLSRYCHQHSLVFGIANEVGDRILAVPYQPAALILYGLLISTKSVHPRQLLRGNQNTVIDRQQQELHREEEHQYPNKELRCGGSRCSSPHYIKKYRCSKKYARNQTAEVERKLSVAGKQNGGNPFIGQFFAQKEVSKGEALSQNELD